MVRDCSVACGGGAIGDREAAGRASITKSIFRSTSISGRQVPSLKWS